MTLSRFHIVKSNPTVQVLNFNPQFFIQHPNHARKRSNFLQDNAHLMFDKTIQQIQNTQRDKQQIEKLTVICTNPKSKQTKSSSRLQKINKE